MEKVWFDSIGSQAHTITGALTHANDPIRSLATYGQWMIGAGTGVIVGSALLKAGTEFAKGSVWGWVADKVTGAVSGLGSLIGFAAGALIAMAAWLIGLGGTLAYYIPVIPFVYWSLAVLGWAVMVIQSLLAAPLWAAAHAADATEDGFAGRWALQGWQLLLNVMLRPILLTIGLIASMLLMHAMAFFILEGYDTFNQAMVNSTSWISILGFLFTNTIMIIFVIIISHKAHELIFDTADDVMKWIGFGVSPLGSTRAEGEVRSMAQHAGSTTERLTGAAMGRLGGDKDDTSPRKPGGSGGGGNGGGSGGGGGGPHVPTQAGGNQMAQRNIGRDA
ncbi:DotA/TraY family protein [Ectothiorhodospira mobilis]|uniref:DotA/TraY family protein n=1 Tax=Ectothiorhodospira mobilis TaxID=195064 RepID=UPI001FD5B26A|nr:DotA/TraY family protein [Ectothiorhodospira mobilis]